MSEDVSDPSRAPEPARKVVKEETLEKDSSDEDQPLKLTRRSVSAATSELPAPRPAAGPSGASHTMRKVLVQRGNKFSTPANDSVLMPLLQPRSCPLLMEMGACKRPPHQQLQALSSQVPWLWSRTSQNWKKHRPRKHGLFKPPKNSLLKHKLPRHSRLQPLQLSLCRLLKHSL